MCSVSTRLFAAESTRGAPALSLTSAAAIRAAASRKQASLRDSGSRSRWAAAGVGDTVDDVMDPPSLSDR